MEVGISKAWASPSTLHLRLWVKVGRSGHLVFRDLHVPLSAVDGIVALETDASEGPYSLGEPLF